MTDLIVPRHEKLNGPDGSYAGALFVWESLLPGQSGMPVDTVGFAQRYFQVDSDDLKGEVICLEGSLDGEHWHALNDMWGVSLARVYPGMHYVAELTRWVRPRMTDSARAPLRDDFPPNVTVTLYLLRIAR